MRIEEKMVKQLREKDIPLIKFVSGGATKDSATWELESHMGESYLGLFFSAKFQGQNFF